MNQHTSFLVIIFISTSYSTTRIPTVKVKGTLRCSGLPYRGAVFFMRHDQQPWVLNETVITGDGQFESTGIPEKTTNPYVVPFLEILHRCGGSKTKYIFDKFCIPDDYLHSQKVFNIGIVDLCNRRLPLIERQVYDTVRRKSSSSTDDEIIRRC
uniref:Transthyretin-like family protein n=1 Tax=Syphacia muris TaxID=451379 RepID=A0A0N5AV88_9BILA